VKTNFTTCSSYHPRSETNISSCDVIGNYLWCN